MFLDEFSKHLELLALDSNRPLVIVGDFNYHMDDNFDQAAKCFADLIDFLLTFVNTLIVLHIVMATLLT